MSTDVTKPIFRPSDLDVNVIQGLIPNQADDFGAIVSFDVGAFLTREQRDGGATLQLDGLPPGLRYAPARMRVEGEFADDAIGGQAYPVTLTINVPGGKNLRSSFQWVMREPRAYDQNARTFAAVPPVSTNSDSTAAALVMALGRGGVVATSYALATQEAAARGGRGGADANAGIAIDPMTTGATAAGARQAQRSDNFEFALIGTNTTGGTAGGDGSANEDAFAEAADAASAAALGQAAKGISGSGEEDDEAQAIPASADTLATDTERVDIGTIGSDGEDGNSAPFAGPPFSASTDEDTPREGIDVLSAAIDFNGDTLVISSATASAGEARINGDGTLTYTPPADFFGTDTITYTIDDGRGGEDTNTIEIDVASVNDLPVAADLSRTTAEDVPLTVIDVAGPSSDADGDTLRIVSASAQNGAVADNGDGTLGYTPNADYSGTDMITYTIDDGNGASSVGTITLIVTPVNDAPDTAADTAFGTEDVPFDIDVLVNDTDTEGDTLTITAVSAASGRVTTDGATIAYAPEPNFFGTDTLTYTVEDGKGGTDTTTVTVTVAPVNDAPVARDDVETTDEDTSVTINVRGNDSDVDGDPLTIASATAGAGTVVISSGTIIYTPPPNFFGTDTVTYTINDGNGLSDTATVTVTVNDVNDAAVAANDAATTREDNGVVIDVLANDSDTDGALAPASVRLSGTTNAGDALTVAGEGVWTVNRSNGEITFTPVADFDGTVTPVTYTVGDDDGAASNSATVSVTITPVDDTPRTQADTGRGPEDAAIRVQVLANDTDVDGMLDPATIRITGTANAGDALAVAGEGTWTVNTTTGDITFTPDANYNGAVTPITYTVEDDGGNVSQPTMVTVTIEAVNDAPDAVADSRTTLEDNAVTIDALANDTDVDGTLDPASVQIVGTANPGDDLTRAGEGVWSVNTANGEITFTPEPDFDGTVTPVSYTVRDDAGEASNSATIDIVITPVDDAPRTADDTRGGPEDTAIRVQVLANDTDVDGTLDPATVQITGTPNAGDDLVIAGEGAWSVNGTTGDITFTPELNYNGLVTPITYTVADKAGNVSDPATVTVTISNVNDAPVALDDSSATSENTPVTLNVLANDSDADGTLNFASLQIVGTSAAGEPLTVAGEGVWSVDTGAGEITFTPEANYAGPVTDIRYTVEDDNGLASNPATVSISIDAVNDAPSFRSDTGDGTTTPTLGAGDDAFETIATLADGAVIAGGYSNAGTTNGYVLTRYDRFGDVDASFGTNGIVTTDFSAADELVRTMEVQSDGKILLAGFRDGGHLVRYNADGSLDTAFGTSGIVELDGQDIVRLNDIAVQDDGAILFTGATNPAAGPSFVIGRLNDDGSFDTTFGGGTGFSEVQTPAADNVGESVLRLANGQYIVAGTATQAGNGSFTLMRFDADGTLDTTFGTNGFADADYRGGLDAARDAILQTDGKVVVAGFGTNGSGNTDALLMRFNTDGTLDTTFGNGGISNLDIGGGNGDDILHAVVQRPDGTFVAVGSTSGGTLTLVAQFLPDGGLDPSFNGGLGHARFDLGGDEAGHAVTLRPDGGILISGFAGNGDSDAVLLALDADGTRDTSFAADTSLDATTAMSEGAAPVVLDTSVNVSDTELDALNGGAGNYDGAMLTLSRNGGANTDDAFGFAAGNGIARAGNVLTKNGADIATFDTTAVPGRLSVAFTAANGETPTSADVDAVLSQITYTNTSDAPDAALQIDWIFSDGNTGAQGSGGAQQALGSTTVTITAVNDAPVTAADADTVAEDGSVTIDVLGNDTDVDGTLDTTSVEIVGAPGTGKVLTVADEGRWTVNTDGTITFAPQPDYAGPVTDIAYTVADNDGLRSAPAAVSMTINAVNDAPIAASDGASGDEDTAIVVTVLDNDNDIDGALDPATIRITGAPGAGDRLVVANQGEWTVDGTAGTITFTPLPDYNGPVTDITYSVADNDGLRSNTATVSVALNDVNDAPIAAADSTTVAEDGSVTIAVLGNDTDVDGTLDTTSVEIVGAPGTAKVLTVAGEGEWTVDTAGTITFTPEAGYTGAVTPIEYTVADDDGARSGPAAVTVTIDNVNDAPTDMRLASANEAYAFNTDGGNAGHYTLADTGVLFAGKDEFTIEVAFATSDMSTSSQTLFALHDGTDAVSLAIANIDTSPSVYFEVNDDFVLIPGYDAAQLLDGGLHTVSASWVSATGDYDIYVDGMAIGSGTGLSIGYTLPADAILSVGQELDPTTPAYDAGERFSGQISTVRVYDDVRTAAEIAATFVGNDDAADVNRIGDWRFDQEDTGTVDNATGPAASDLTFENVTGPGLLATAPAATLLIAENTSAGTVAATLGTIDADAGDTHTYTIVSDTSGSFDIVGNEVRVATGSTLDYEATTEHTLTIETADGNGGTYQETFAVSVTNVSDSAPTGIDAEGQQARNGTAINTDGGNAAYYEVGALPAASLGQFTIEVQFSVLADLPVSERVSLLSANNGGTSDRLEMAVFTDPQYDHPIFQFEINGEQVLIEAVDATPYLDGSQHTYALSWSATTGDYTVYADGVEIGSGTGVSVGTPLPTDGALIFGKDQDTSGGGFDTNQSFSGVFHDIRVFDDVRTDAELAASSNAALPATTANLVANWNFGEGDPAIVADTINGNDATLQQVTGTGWRPSTAVQVVTVNEAATPGTVVALLTALDPDIGDAHTFQLVSNPGDNFEIVGNELRVVAGATLDTETAPVVTLVVRATDGAGNSVDVTHGVYVSDTAEALTLSSSRPFVDNGVAETSITGSAGRDTIYGNYGDDTIEGSSGEDVIFGRSGDDALSGGDDNDRLSGGTGDDALSGGTGDDILAGGRGADTLDGGLGFDRVDYADAGEGVVAIFQTTDAAGFGVTGPYGAYAATASGGYRGDATGDTYSGVEAVTGSAFADAIYGGGNGITADLGAGNDLFDNEMITTGVDIVDGGDGNDTILTGGGDDTLLGGAGNDTLTGQDGADVHDGGTGFDTVVLQASATTNVAIFEDTTPTKGIHGDYVDTAAGGYGGQALGDTYASIERVIGSQNADDIYGTSSGFQAELGGGNDRFDNNFDAFGVDTIDGGAGNDLIAVGGGNDIVSGGTGDDTVYGEGGNDVLDGGAGTDTAVYYGNRSDYTIVENPNGSLTVTDDRPGSPDGIDTLTNFERLQFADSLFTPGALQQLARGRPGNDTLAGDATDQFFYAEAGNDTVSGGGGADLIAGQDGADILDGEDGDDTLFGDRLQVAADTVLDSRVINTTAAGNQSAPVVTALHDGTMFVAWYDDAFSATPGQIRGQITTADGTRSGAEFTIGGSAPEGDNATEMPPLTAQTLADGNVLIGWQTEGSANIDGSGSRVSHLVFNTETGTTGTEFSTNATSAGSQSGPVIVALADGGAFLAWYDNADLDTGNLQVRGRFLDADGLYASGEFTIGTSSLEGSGDFDMPPLTATALAGGDIAVAWSTDVSAAADGSGSALVGAIIDAATQTAGAEVRLNEDATSNQSAPVIVALADGRFFATWYDAADGDGIAIEQVQYRFFNADGTPATAQAQASSIIVEGGAGNEMPPLTALGLDNGNVFLTFQSDDTANVEGNGTNALVGLVIDGTTGAASTPTTINSTITDNQSGAVLVELDDGRIFAAWYDDADTDDTGNLQVRGQILNADGSKSGSELRIGQTDVEGADTTDMPPLTATLTANGDVYVAWQGNDTFNADGQGTSVITSLVRTETSGGNDTLDGGAGNDALYGGVGNDTLRGGAGNDVLAGDTADYGVQVTDLDPVAYYRLDDTDGTAIDASANGNDGIYRGNSTPDAGAVEQGGSIRFNGSDGNILVSDNTALDVEEGTFSFWFNTVEAREMGLLSIDSDGSVAESHLTISKDATGELHVRVQGDNTETNMVVGTSLDDGAWHHVVFTFDASGLRLFLDGTQVGADSRIFSLAGTVEPLVIGASQVLSANDTATSLSNFFEGRIDEVAVFDRALDLQIVETLHGTRLAPTGSNDDTLDGGTGDDVLMGGAGDDTLVGGAGADVLSGGLGVDTADYSASLSGVEILIEATTATDTLLGTRANESAGGKTGDATGDSYDSIESFVLTEFDDALYGNATGNTVTLNGGDDLFDVEGTSTGVDVVYGGDGNDTIATDGGDDTLYGGADNDELYAGNGDDTLYGGTQDDILRGGAGTDRLFGDAGDDTLDGGEGADAMDGGAGVDMLSYATATGGVDVLLSDSDANGLNGAYANGTAGGKSGDAAGDTYAGFELFEGSAFGDRVYGFDTGTVANLGDGDDLFENNSLISQVDSIDGGAGNDLVFTGGGNDTLTGGAGNDTLWGEGDADTLTGGDGDDLLYGGDDDDDLDGGAGVDTAGYQGDFGEYTIVDNGNGTHTVTNIGNSRNDGVDQLVDIEFVRFDDRTIDLSVGPDAPVADLDTNRAGTGYSGNHVSGTGETKIVSRTPAITDPQDDIGIIRMAISGTDDASNELIYLRAISFAADANRSGNAFLAGTDTSYVYSGTSQLLTIVPRSAATFTAAEVEGILGELAYEHTNAPFSDTDRTFTFTFEDGAGNISSPAVSTLTLLDDQPSATTNTVTGTGNGDDPLDGTAANDFIDGLEGNDVINGFAGDDRIVAGRGDDEVFGGDGNDHVLGGIGNDDIFGGAGNDYIDGGDANDLLDGGAGHDVIIGGGGNDTISGGDGNDHLDGGDGSDTFDGGAGDDTIIGGLATNRVEYSGNAADYTVMDNGDGTYTVSDIRTGSPDGTDTLTDIDVLRFADGNEAPANLAVVSPIAFDFDGSGAIETTGETTAQDRSGTTLGWTVAFDMDGDGITENIEWLSGTGDALLVDNADGMASTDMNGTRLFGDQGGTYDHGYQQLATHDVDGSGAIDGTELDTLALWADDGDARVQEGEMVSLADMGIVSIDLTLDADARDADGRDLFRSTATLHDGSTMMTEDVWFARAVDTDEEENIMVPPTVQMTPYEELVG